MTIDNVLTVDPEQINTVAEVDEVLMSLAEYETRILGPACVVLRQNLQLGGTFIITSEEYATNRDSSKPEKYAKTYLREYFEKLKKSLKDSAL